MWQLKHNGELLYEHERWSTVVIEASERGCLVDGQSIHGRRSKAGAPYRHGSGKLKPGYTITEKTGG